MENSGYKGERLSFIKLFSERKYKLVIPIIQRDYAQGRKNDDTNEVRNDFLEALYTYLDEGMPNRDLDFVYGTLQNDKDDTRTHFIPLDGQQRLTTLFLLHWFLAQISGDAARERLNSNLLDGTKSLFTYETRQSTTDFCDSLMQAHIDIDNLLTVKDKDKSEVPSLSKTIKNEPWFFRVWKNDPTIQSMLVMLDAIYHKFNQRPDFFDLLMDESRPVITFIFMDLKEYKLTDDLYIKMNSRGKPLTRFENFKAKFEQYLKDLKVPEGREFRLKFGGDEQQVSLKEYFSHNIDTKWTTLFWQYCKDGKQNQLDIYIQNFIRTILTIHYATVAQLPPKKTSDETFDVLMSGSDSISFNKYESTRALTVDSVLALVDALDALYNGHDKIKTYLSESYRYYYNEGEIFNKVITNSLTRNERMMFYAYIQYLIHHRNDLTGIDEWMRVIHNLCHPDNTVVDGNDDMARGIRSIANMVPYATDIIGYLKKTGSIDGFSRHQGKEEVIKAHLVAMPQWKDRIESTEKHNYFNGQIGFILEFAGIKAMFDNEQSTWDEATDATLLSAFDRNSNIACFLFMLDDGGKRRINDIDYCFERAVLAHGDYLIAAPGGYWNLLSTETVAKNVKRDYSWRRLLRFNDDTYKDKKALVKETFDAIDERDIISSLEAQCQAQETLTWRNLFIDSPEMFSVSEYGYTYFDDESIYILNKWYLNNYHKDLYTYHLWRKCIKGALDEITAFADVRYEQQKRADIAPYISFNDFTYRRYKYQVQIHSSIEDGVFKKYNIWFSFRNEKKLDYPDEIESVLTELHFKRESEGSSWWLWSCTTEGGALSKLKALSAALRAHPTRNVNAGAVDF